MEKLLIVTGSEANRPLYWSLQFQFPGVIKGVSLSDLVGWGLRQRLVNYFEALSEQYEIHVVVLAGQPVARQDAIAIRESVVAIGDYLESHSICLTKQPPLAWEFLTHG